MTAFYRLGVFVGCIVLLEGYGSAQSLGAYRGFEFGMGVESVARQAQVAPGGAATIHTKPDLLQTLQWDAPSYFSSPAAVTDPARGMRFYFYNNQLFKIVATYDRRRIEGMTADDLIDAISSIYGPAVRTDETVVISAYRGYEDRQKALARWASGDGAYVLFRSSYGGEFGLIGYSRKLEALAAASLLEAGKQEVLAAPQRELDRKRQEDDDRRVQEEKARSINKPNFRP